MLTKEETLSALIAKINNFRDAFIEYGIDSARFRSEMVALFNLLNEYYNSINTKQKI